MRSFTTVGIEYSHRFLGYEGEAQYLHGHHGQFTIEVEGGVDAKTGFVFPCNAIKAIVWKYLQNFDHANILQREDPLLSPLLETYEKQGIKGGAATNKTRGPAFENDLAKAYPECRLVVVKKVATCENLIEVFYSLIKDELESKKVTIKKITFTSGMNGAVERY
ncbi:MAG: 6-carboxytetrahydropterin synthase [Planctomycetota bacterium]|jgi:6-pyruvoyltetrahydropterin/6-carboxytetrahydropterin synthase|nr:6-carboxytetrahydropterin synthase [Planctomycetota bacterium]